MIKEEGRSASPSVQVPLLGPSATLSVGTSSTNTPSDFPQQTPFCDPYKPAVCHFHFVCNCRCPLVPTNACCR